MKLHQVLLLLLLGHEAELRALGPEETPQDNLGLLYPFGPGVGDEVTPTEDDGMSPEQLLQGRFSFYGRPQTSLYVNNNGVVSFGRGVPEYTPKPFPLAEPIPFVAPYWADVDLRLGGKVFYRQSRERSLLARLRQDLAAAAPPQGPAPSPTWAFLATWHQVAFFGAASNKTNTFQAVLASDEVSSYVMLNYGSLQWTTGIADGGNAHSGLGGLPAQAGFNSGDDLHYYNLPGSRTPEVLSIARRSNVAVPGRWIFRVDEFTATEPPPTPAPGTAVPPAPPQATTQKAYICN
ncbi:sushi, nidogen and EGF-like domain-containing protein 1 [Melanerpes formicivorus]|uniref:sushi, nidogen and EGF-like domain-containing protein 1 n=1 Tax=Melanerpes formicivorus TaxID=211600 RepID=UPI00358EE68B